MAKRSSEMELLFHICDISLEFFAQKQKLNKAANADNYPRAEGPILGNDLTTRKTKPLVDSAALRGSRVKTRLHGQFITREFMVKDLGRTVTK